MSPHVLGRMKRPIAAPMIGSARRNPVVWTITGGDDDADGAERVAHDLEVGAPYVQALAGPLVQQPHCPEIHREPGRGDPEHRAPEDLGRRPEPSVGLVEDHSCNAEEDGPVGQCGEDLHPVVAVRVSGRWRPPREPGCDETQDETPDVR
jgi:hypothetical protein